MFAYCRNNPVNREDAQGTEDLCSTSSEDDDNIFNDMGSVRGGGGGASGGNCTGGSGGSGSSGSGGGTKGGGHSNSGHGSMTNSFGLDRPVSPRQISKSALKNVDVHTFKRGYVGNDGNRWDLYKDTANNAAIWLGNKAQTLWIATEYVFEELFEYFLKGGK